MNFANAKSLAKAILGIEREKSLDAIMKFLAALNQVYPCLIDFRNTGLLDNLSPVSDLRLEEFRELFGCAGKWL
jgi:hypothetical protein